VPEFGIKSFVSTRRIQRTHKKPMSSLPISNKFEKTKIRLLGYFFRDFCSFYGFVRGTVSNCVEWSLNRVNRFINEKVMTKIVF